MANGFNIEKRLCWLELDGMTPDEAIEEIRSESEKHKALWERLEIRLTGDGSDDYCEANLHGSRRATPEEVAARESEIEAGQRREYDRLRAKFEPMDRAAEASA